MADHAIFGQRPHVGQHRPAGERLKRGRADEALRRLGHDHIDDRALKRQIAGQLGDLVGRDAAAHAQDDLFAG